MCNFLNLPCELRSMIYDLVLLKDESLTLSDKHLYQWIDVRRYQDGKPNILTYRTPALLLTCHLIRWEASPVYYSKVQFRFTEAETCIRWLSAMENESRHDVKALAYCPNYLTWMDPRQPPIATASLAKQWSGLCDYFQDAEIDIHNVLRICGYGGGRLGWIVADNLDFMYMVDKEAKVTRIATQDPN